MSAAAAEKTLAEFAAHTRHADYEKANLTQIARKWLAVHVTAAPVKQVYNFVGEDYELLELRTHTPLLNTYQRQALNPETFVYVMKNGYKNDPLHEEILPLAHFKDTLFPKPVGEEAWVAYKKEDHWKPRAYFLATKCSGGKELYPLVKAICAEDMLLDKDAAADMYTRITRYMTDNAWLKVDAADMGTLLNEMELPVSSPINLETAPVETPLPTPAAAAAEDDDEIKPQLIETSLMFTPCTPPTKTIDELRALPAVQDYRKRACLNATFPVAKLMKQIVLAAIGAPVQKEVCAKSQQSFANVPAKEEMAAILETAIDAIEEEKIVAAVDASAPAFRDFVNSHYKLGHPIDARGFLKRILSVYASPSSAAQEQELGTKRYLKRYPVPDSTLINCILAL